MNADTAERIVRLRLAVGHWNEVISKLGAWSGAPPPCVTDPETGPHSNELHTGYNFLDIVLSLHPILERS